MKTRRGQGRALFLTYICGAYAAVLLAAPLLGSLSPASARALAAYQTEVEMEKVKP